MAQDHYLQVTDAHFAQAVKAPSEKAAQNPAHSTAVTVGNDQNAAKATNENRPELPGDTSPCTYLHGSPVTPTGSEHPSDSTGKQQIPQQGGAFSGALGGEIAPALAEVVRAWPTLPADVRANILALVQAAK